MTGGRIGAWLGLFLLAAPLIACPSRDESADGGDGGTGNPPTNENFEGHEVTCCYLGYFDSETDGSQAVFCAGGFPQCLDPAIQGTDPEDVQAFCDLKCDGTWTVSTVSSPAGQYYDQGDRIKS